MRFIGDIHSDFEIYKTLSRDADASFQVGDMGLFKDADLKIIKPNPRASFIRGNHDNPEVCRKHPDCLPDYGFNVPNSMFWLAGGYSVDHPDNPRVSRKRHVGIDWWPDEELSWEQLALAADEYVRVKPRIMVSHECPSVIKTILLSMLPAQRLRDSVDLIGAGTTILTRTESALQSMFDSHKPEIWIFGHYHFRMDEVEQGTRFICLGSNRGPMEEMVFEIPGMTW